MTLSIKNKKTQVYLSNLIEQLILFHVFMSKKLPAPIGTRSSVDFNVRLCLRSFEYVRFVGYQTLLQEFLLR